MHGQRYDIDGTLTFDVHNGEAVGPADWNPAAQQVNIDSGGPDIVADTLTATTEGALSVIVSSAAWADAVSHLAKEIDNLSFRVISASPDAARRIND